MTRPPMVFDRDAPAPETPATAPPVPEPGQVVGPDGVATDPGGRAMRQVGAVVAYRPSRLARLFWSSALGLVGFVASVAAWDFVTALLGRNVILGWVALGLIALVLLSLLVFALRELAGFARLRRLDRLNADATAALAAGDLGGARDVSAKLSALYADRPELRLGLAELAARRDEVLDADTALRLAERHLLEPLDARARHEVEAAARQVATVTALVPLALADLIAALSANLRMIRQVAEIYGGRPGVLGNWRLTRAVMTHLVATGAVAVGDDMLGSFAGGGVLSKLSRRFGEGVVNGALTARVGVAAIEVCRPLPFVAAKRPSVTRMVQRALAGLFGRGKSGGQAAKSE